MKTVWIVFFFCGALFFSGCATFKKISFPPKDEMFITTGDGDITQPYEPVGHLVYQKKGFRIPLFLFGFIPISDALAEDAINAVIAEKARAMGGNAVINLKIEWNPPSDGILGFGANGGTLVINGTVIKQSFAPRTSAPTPTAVSVATTPTTTGTATPKPSSQTPTSRVGQSTDLMKLLLQGDPVHSPFLAYGGGIRLGYVLRRHVARFAFTPAISFGGMTDETTFSAGSFFNSSTGRFEQVRETLKTHYRLIPLDLNITANFSAFPNLSASLPPKLNPYAEAGLTYLIWSARSEFDSQFFGSGESDTHWDFFEPGLNLGVGVDYFVQPNLAVSGGLKRYIFFKSQPKLGFWNWQVGVSFYSGGR